MTLNKKTIKKTLEQVIPELTLEHFGGNIPYEAWGTLGDYNFYFRSRGGFAHLRLSTGNPVAVEETHWSTSQNLLDEGEEEFTDHADFFKMMVSMVKSLERQPFKYLFEGYRVIIENEDDTMKTRIIGTDTPALHPAWGNSLNEATANLVSINPELVEAGLTEEMQREIHEKAQYGELSLESPIDTRVFLTEEAPRFAVVSLSKGTSYNQLDK